jgi:hypothetical protein
MWSDVLTVKEVRFTERAIAGLEGVPWAQDVLDRLQQSGGFKLENKPFMFEVRFAYELHRAGAFAEYEYSAGVGDSTVDFYVPGDITWLIDLVSIRTSQAAKKAIIKKCMPPNDIFYEQILSSNANDIAQSPEAEMITAQQKIGEKVFADGKPTKFPVPRDNDYHVILTDMRGFLDFGGDRYDYRQMAYGASGLPQHYLHYWENEPIKGLLEESCPLRAARFIQERIHFLGFVCEREYREGEIPKASLYLTNHHLLSDEEVKKISQAFPLKHG